MMQINKQIQVMNSLAISLAQDVLDLRVGKLSQEKAKSISQLSGKAIKAIAEGVMIANHHEIQRGKINARNKRTEVINKNIDFKNKKLTTKIIK